MSIKPLSLLAESLETGPWRKISASHRGDLLFKLADLM